jgi:Concanavalin A-like lectin/glucanases superfamily
MALFDSSDNNIFRYNFSGAGLLTDTGGDANGLDLTNTNSVTTTTGRDGVSDSAALFTAASKNYLSHADSSVYNVATLSLWAAFNAASIPASGATLIAKYGSAGNRSFELFIDTSNNARFYCSSDGTAIGTAIGTTTISLDTDWIIEGKYDGATVSVWVNGVQEGTTSSLTGSVFNSSAVFCIGCRSDILATLASTHFDGTIYDTSGWGRYISSTESLLLKDMGEDFNYSLPVTSRSEADTFTAIGIGRTAPITTRSDADTFTAVVVDNPNKSVVVSSRSETESFTDIDYQIVGTTIVTSRSEADTFTAVSPYVSSVVVVSRSETDSFIDIATNINFIVTVLTRSDSDVFTAIATNTAGYTHDITWRIVYNGVPITGATVTMIWERNVDGYLYDFDDSTFKASGWTTENGSMTEVDATNLAGAYRKTLSIYQLNGTYTVYTKYAGATTALDQYGKPIELVISDGVIMNFGSGAPTIQQIRAEIDANSTQLSKIDSIPTAPQIATAVVDRVIP